MSHAISGEYQPAAQFFGNARRWQLIRWIRSLLNDPTKGVLDPETKQRFVFLSARAAAEELNCNINTAAADLKALTEGEHLERDKLGGRGIQPNGRVCSHGMRSWFYRLGRNLPEWLGLGNAIPNKQAKHHPVIRQSNQEKTFPRDPLPKAQGSKDQQPVSRQVIEERQSVDEAYETYQGSPQHLNGIAQAEALAGGQQPTALTRESSERPLEGPVGTFGRDRDGFTVFYPSSPSEASPGSSPSLSVSPPPSQDSPLCPLGSSTHSNPSLLPSDNRNNSSFNSVDTQPKPV